MAWARALGLQRTACQLCLGDEHKESDALHVAIDFREGTVTVEGFLTLFKIKSVKSDEVYFTADDHDWGSINRYSGQIGVFMILKPAGTGTQNFNGLCHQAERLF